MALEDPIVEHGDEVLAMVRTAADEGRVVDGYFGASRYWGVARPSERADGRVQVRFTWLGPRETRGERRFVGRPRLDRAA